MVSQQPILRAEIEKIKKSFEKHCTIILLVIIVVVCC